MTFYEISSDNRKKGEWAYGIIIGDYPKVMIDCSVCGRNWRKEKLLDKNSDITVALVNDNFADFADVIYHKLIKSEALELLQNNEIKGISAGHINIMLHDELSLDALQTLKKKGCKINLISDSVPQYYRLFANVGISLHERSEIELLDFCDACGYKKFITPNLSYLDPSAPIYFARETWNGDDLFMTEELGASLFCSEKFVQVYKENNLTGLKFSKIEFL
ncbi:hypothetical protein [Cohnella silvisoli]|uniref:Uncharacterized protein n=1 Tax=Cohnella silvisoli TaxID=2873699 RepID=A0ABV1KYE5_9BACL|nr:hypothetical protein [Cohnella silvisoli]MCD9024486.1 hypothetical protein [Cohnella silvisoli]